MITPSTGTATYKGVSSIIHDIYNSEASMSSTALDMLSVYLKGQKTLYIEAKTYCEKNLNSLMLPAIMISAASSVLSLQFQSQTYGGVMVASLAAFNSCILSLISYLKLDAKAEAHKTSAYKFDKLQSLCEFQSGKVLFFDNASVSAAQDVSNVLTYIEAQVKEIKETNQFVLPESIRYNYPVLYSTNVFSLVKKLQNEEIVLTNRLKIAINNVVTAYEGGDRIQADIQSLEVEQNTVLENLIKFRNKYLDIDDKFKEEIHRQSKKTSRGWCGLWGRCKS
jgi:hypothetical protein